MIFLVETIIEYLLYYATNHHVSRFCPNKWPKTVNFIVMKRSKQTEPLSVSVRSWMEIVGHPLRRCDGSVKFIEMIRVMKI